MQFIFPMLFFPIWIFLLLIFLMFLLFIFWIWAIVDCLTSEISVAEKLFWIIVIIFLHVIGALIYYIVTRTVKKPIIKMDKKTKGKKLFRSKKNRVIAGVCGGLGEYLGIDPTVIRLLWVLFTLFTGVVGGLLVYIIAWIIIPEGK